MSMQSMRLVLWAGAAIAEVTTRVNDLIGGLIDNRLVLRLNLMLGEFVSLMLSSNAFAQTSAGEIEDAVVVTGVLNSFAFAQIVPVTITAA